MSTILDAFEQWLRDYVVDGNPGSGVNAPSKAEGRAIGALIEGYVSDQIAASAGAGGAAKLILDCGDEVTPLVPGEVKRFRLPYGFNLSEVRASLTNPSDAGASPADDRVLVDIELTGESPPLSILGDKLQIDGGETTTVGSISPPTITTNELDDNAELAIIVLEEGTNASGLKVYMIGTWAAFGVGQIPYFVSAGFSVGSLFTGNYVAFPDGVRLYDIALLEVMVDNVGGSPITRPSGWNTIINPASGASLVSALFWKRCDGTESLTHQPVTVSNTGSATGGSISIWRGCVQNGDPYESYATDGGASTVASGAAVTTLGPNRRAVTIYSLQNSQTTDPDTGWIENFDSIVGISSPHTHVGSSQGLPLPATTTPEARVLSLYAAWISHNLALVPSTS